jgi:hypothetical protein
MTLPPETHLRWHNASSGEETCVDIAHTKAALRDSKNPTGPVLSVNIPALLAAVKTGRIT